MQFDNSGNETTQRQFLILFVAGIIAFLPSLFVLATWDIDGIEGASAFAIRYLSVPVTIGEIVVVMLAVSRGFEIFSAFARLPSVAKVLFGVWGLFAILALLQAEAQLALSAFTTIRYALHGLFFASVMHLIQGSRNFGSDRWISIFAVGGATYVAALILFALTVPDKQAFPWTLRMPSGTNVRQIGYYAAIMGVAPLALLLFAKRAHWLGAISFTLIVTFVSWTGSRGALFGLIVGATAAVLFTNTKPAISRIMLACGLVATGVGASIALPNPAPEFGVIRMMDSSTAKDISSGRSKIWTVTLHEVIENPLIGHGAGTFNQNMKSEYGFDLNHPHQVFLQYAYDWGVVGAGAALILLVVLFKSIWRAARMRNDAGGYAALGAFLVIMTIALIDGALFYPLSIAIALAIMASGIVIGNDIPTIASLMHAEAEIGEP